MKIKGCWRNLGHISSETTTDSKSGAAAPTESRRARQRRELTAEIIAIARRQLVEGGRAGVSWRAIAREVGMNPASLYTYFANLDELFTAMILESYHSLAHSLDRALEQALARATVVDEGTEPPADESVLIEVALAYRTWAVEHPAQYNLIFTDQIPGYAAPPGGPTVDAETAVIEALVTAFGRASGLPYTTSDQEQAPPELVDRLVQIWAVLHGLVALEINHHLPFIDGHERLVADAMHRAVADLPDPTQG